MNAQTPPAEERTTQVVGKGEVPFALNEMIYSRTDTRGVILGANDVFQRVGGYEWDRLVGAPHKLIRHPDMPKGIFFHIWDEIKSGKPAGAYVKNRNEDGRFYWTFAVISPLGEDYVSVRIKPSTDLRGDVEDLYKDLVQKEAEGLKPEASRDLFVEMLRDKGFDSYAHFQSEAISREFRAMTAGTGKTLDGQVERFAKMMEALDLIRQETTEMMEGFDSIRTIPMNMRILASRLESAGGPISAISVNYGSMSDEMAAWVREFVIGDDSQFARISNSIWAGMFLRCTTEMQSQMAESLTKAEIDLGPCSRDVEIEKLSDLVASMSQTSLESIKQVEIEAAQLTRNVQDMKRYITGLSSTRMMCKIESATLPKSGETLVGIVSQLDSAQDGIEKRLSRISELNAAIQSNTSMLKAVNSQ